MGASQEKPIGHEGGEDSYFPDDVLSLFENIGENAEERWLNDHPGIRSSHSQPDRFDAIFTLSNGSKAKFGWSRGPSLYRPWRWLPSGSLTIKADRDGVEHADLFSIGRHIHHEVQPTIKYHGYENNDEVDAVDGLTDAEKLREAYTALEEIEQAINDPVQPVLWRAYGVAYDW